MAGGNALLNDAGDVTNRAGVPIGLGADYAGITAAEAASLLTVDLVDLFHKFRGFAGDMPEKISDGQNANDRIKVGATGDYKVQFSASGTAAANNKVYEFHCYNIQAAATTITAATKASPCVITAASHGKSNGDEICIVSAGGMVELNNKIYKVKNVATDTMELTDEEDVNLDSSAFTTYTSGGTVQKATKILAHCHVSFAVGADFNSINGHTIVSLTKDDFVELYVACETDTTNFTFDDVNMSIDRKG